MGYFDDEIEKTEYRRLFLPDLPVLIAEFVSSLGLLVLFVIGDIGKSVSPNPSVAEANPVTYLGDWFSKMISFVDELSVTPIIATLLLWSVVGLVAYLAIYQVASSVMKAKDDVEEAEEVNNNKLLNKRTNVMAETIRNIIVNILLWIVGMMLLFFVIIFLFPYTATISRVVLFEPEFRTIFLILQIPVFAFLSVRFIMLALCLMLRRLRLWYCR